MMMKMIPYAVLASTAGLTLANPVTSQAPTLSIQEAQGAGDWLTIDVGGIQFFDGAGSPINEALHYFASFGTASITQVSWDITLTTIGASWASDASLDINGNTIVLGGNDPFPVSNQHYFGSADLDINLQSVNDFLSIEFYESFDDVGGEADAFFEAGSTITLYGPLLWLEQTDIPAPSSLLTMGCFALCSRRKRR